MEDSGRTGRVREAGCRGRVETRGRRYVVGPLEPGGDAAGGGSFPGKRSAGSTRSAVASIRFEARLGFCGRAESGIGTASRARFANGGPPALGSGLCVLGGGCDV